MSKHTNQDQESQDQKKGTGVVVVSEETHQKLRERAAKERKTIKELAEELLEKGGLDENDD